MYPLKFEPILKSTIWGGDDICKFKDITSEQNNIGESWEIAQVKSDVSVIANGEFKGCTLSDMIDRFQEKFVGRHVWNIFGNKFPLLIKFIDARDDLSIQVHPDDKLALQRHQSLGKTEMWYVIDAQKGSGLYAGFSKQTSPDEYVERITNNTFVDTLQFFEVAQGDAFFLPAGKVHAIGKGLFITEIQQSSDITYRIYDYNRTDANGNARELHTELAKDAIDFAVNADSKVDYPVLKNETNKLISCKYFETNFLDLNEPKKIDIREKDSFFIYICMEGSCDVVDNNHYTVNLKQGETLLIPANTEYITIEPKETVKLLECYIL